jgi:hypothetical protein
LILERTALTPTLSQREREYKELLEIIIFIIFLSPWERLGEGCSF